MKERVLGLFMLAVGFGLGYLCVYKPLEDAKSGAAEVSLSLKGAFLVPMCLIGVLYLTMGERTTAIMGTREKPKPAAAVIGILLALAGVGLYLWLRSVLEAHGYDFKGKF
jgi:hypothetical protein